MATEVITPEVYERVYAYDLPRGPQDEFTPREEAVAELREVLIERACGDINAQTEREDLAIRARLEAWAKIHRPDMEFVEGPTVLAEARGIRPKGKIQ